MNKVQALAWYSRAAKKGLPEAVACAQSISDGLDPSRKQPKKEEVNHASHEVKPGSVTDRQETQKETLQAEAKNFPSEMPSVPGRTEQVRTDNSDSFAWLVGVDDSPPLNAENPSEVLALAVATPVNSQLEMPGNLADQDRHAIQAGGKLVNYAKAEEICFGENQEESFRDGGAPLEKFEPPSSPSSSDDDTTVVASNCSEAEEGESDLKLSHDSPCLDQHDPDLDLKYGMPKLLVSQLSEEVKRVLEDKRQKERAQIAAQATPQAAIKPPASSGKLNSADSESTSPETTTSEGLADTLEGLPGCKYGWSAPQTAPLGQMAAAPPPTKQSGAPMVRRASFGSGSEQDQLLLKGNDSKGDIRNGPSLEKTNKIISLPHNFRNPTRKTPSATNRKFMPQPRSAAGKLADSYNKAAVLKALTEAEAGSGAEEEPEPWARQQSESPYWENIVDSGGQNWLDDDPAPKKAVRSYSMVSYGEVRGPQPIQFPADLALKAQLKAQRKAELKSRKVTWGVSAEGGLTKDPQAKPRPLKAASFLLQIQKEAQEQTMAREQQQEDTAEILEGFIGSLGLEPSPSPISAVKLELQKGCQKQAGQGEEAKKVVTGHNILQQSCVPPLDYSGFLFAQAEAVDTASTELSALDKATDEPAATEAGVETKAVPEKQTVALGTVVQSLLSPVWLETDLDSAPSDSASETEPDRSGGNVEEKSSASDTSVQTACGWAPDSKTEQASKVPRPVDSTPMQSSGKEFGSEEKQPSSPDGCSPEEQRRAPDPVSLGTKEAEPPESNLEEAGENSFAKHSPQKRLREQDRVALQQSDARKASKWARQQTASGTASESLLQGQHAPLPDPTAQTLQTSTADAPLVQEIPSETETLGQDDGDGKETGAPTPSPSAVTAENDISFLQLDVGTGMQDPDESLDATPTVAAGPAKQVVDTTEVPSRKGDAQDGLKVKLAETPELGKEKATETEPLKAVLPEAEGVAGTQRTDGSDSGGDQHSTRDEEAVKSGGRPKLTPKAIPKGPDSSINFSSRDPSLKAALELGYKAIWSPVGMKSVLSGFHSPAQAAELQSGDEAAPGKDTEPLCESGQALHSEGLIGKPASSPEQSSSSILPVQSEHSKAAQDKPKTSLQLQSQDVATGNSRSTQDDPVRAEVSKSFTPSESIGPATPAKLDRTKSMSATDDFITALAVAPADELVVEGKSKSSTSDAATMTTKLVTATAAVSLSEPKPDNHIPKSTIAEPPAAPEVADDCNPIPPAPELADLSFLGLEFGCSDFNLPGQPGTSINVNVACLPQPTETKPDPGMKSAEANLKSAPDSEPLPPTVNSTQPPQVSAEACKQSDTHLQSLDQDETTAPPSYPELSFLGLELSPPEATPTKTAAANLIPGSTAGGKVPESAAEPALTAPAKTLTPSPPTILTAPPPIRNRELRAQVEQAVDCLDATSKEVDRFVRDQGTVHKPGAYRLTPPYNADAAAKPDAVGFLGLQVGAGKQVLGAQASTTGASRQTSLGSEGDSQTGRKQKNPSKRTFAVWDELFLPKRT